jgi:hypothetical protein
MHDHRRVASTALPDLQPTTELADTAPPRLIVQAHRTPRPPPRGRRTSQNQPQTTPRLGRPSTARRPHPTPTRSAARASPGHPGHGPALAPPPGHQEVDLPEPLRSPTCRPGGHLAGRTDGPRERDLGLPAHPRRTSQAPSEHPRSAESSSGGGYRQQLSEQPTRPGAGSCEYKPPPR